VELGNRDSAICCNKLPLTDKIIAYNEPRLILPNEDGKRGHIIGAGITNKEP
jgi:hypothetical protein